jgi:hypothetical protein
MLDARWRLGSWEKTGGWRIQHPASSIEHLFDLSLKAHFTSLFRNCDNTKAAWPIFCDEPM